MTAVLDALTKDAYPVGSSQRPARCTGAALQVAEAVLSACVPPGAGAARIMLFVGGPCTEGGGKVIGRYVRWRGLGAGAGVAWPGEGRGGGAEGAGGRQHTTR